MTARAAFRARDLTRAIKTAQAAGLPVVRTRITADGDIELVHQGEASEASDYDKWSARRGQGQSAGRGDRS